MDGAHLEYKYSLTSFEFSFTACSRPLRVRAKFRDGEARTVILDRGVESVEDFVRKACAALRVDPAVARDCVQVEIQVDDDVRVVAESIADLEAIRAEDIVVLEPREG